MKTLVSSWVLASGNLWAPFLLVAVTLMLLASPYPYMAPLPGLGMLVLLLLGRWNLRSALFYGIVLLIPFGAYRTPIGELELLRLHWVLAIALAGLVAMDTLLRKSLPRELHNRSFWMLVFGFVIANAISLPSSGFPAVSMRFLMLLVAGFMLVALGMIVLDDRGFTQILPMVVVGSVVMGSVLAVLGYTMDLPVFISPKTGRAAGGAPDPNNMSLMIIFSIPLLVYFLLTTRHPLRRLGLLLALGINVGAIVLTFSRGGALILGLSIPLILWEYRRMIAPRNLGLLLGLSGLALIVFVLLAPDTYGRRIQSLRDGDDFVINRRYSYILVARDLFQQHPVLGSGPDTFSSLYAQTEVGRYFTRQREDGRRKAHNTYLEVLVGTGLFGFAWFFGVLLYAYYGFSHAKRRFLEQGMLREALVTGAYRVSFLTLLLYFLIYSDVYHKYLLLSLALSMVALRLARESGKAGDDVYAAR